FQRRSPDADYCAETGAVRVTPVRREEIVLLGADPDVVDRLDSLVGQLRSVGGSEIEQESIASPLAHERRIELLRHLGSDLIAAPAYARTDARPDTAAAELALHEPHR